MFGKKKQAAPAVTTNPAPAEGTDWIPEGALKPVYVEESAEAEIAPYQNTWEKFWSIFKHSCNFSHFRIHSNSCNNSLSASFCNHSSTKYHIFHIG